MPEDDDGELPVDDADNECDNPDEWRDACDDPTIEPNGEDDEP